ncbi:MAG: acylneuraminate cytidylyltransferase family protein [Endomicrobiales bacterium]|nr:acylneuraminate cytidylyltransferase family protein [Endomicrobiales bacterium]
MSIVAIIPARGGSKGVPGKNIRLLAGYPLIAYSVAAAKLSKKIERIIISTDSDEIAAICKKFGAEVPFMRPSALAQDKSTDLDFMIHALSWFMDNEKGIPDYWVHLRPTTPLRNPMIIDMAISDIIVKSNSTSLRSAHKAPESPFKWFKKNEEGFFTSLMNGLRNDKLNDPRQVFPDAYVPDGYVDILKASFIMNNKILHGDKMIGFISPFCTEVDSSEDFEYLEYEIKSKGSVLLNFLKMNFPKGSK